jgi:hypothetical protein
MTYYQELTGCSGSTPPEHMSTHGQPDPRLVAIAVASVDGPKSRQEVKEILASEDLCYHLRRLWAERPPSTELRTRILAEFGELGEKLLRLA